MTKETKKKPVKTSKSLETSKKKAVAALDDDFADAFIKEVDEDVKNDNLKAMWDKYGLYIVILVVASLTLAVSFESIKAWKLKRDQAATNTYISTIEMKNNGKLEESLLMLRKISEDGSGIYRDIAKLQTVNILLEQGKVEEAVEELKAIVANEKINQSLRAASRLKLVSLQFDNFTSAEINELLQPLENDAEWKPYAAEFIAMAAIRDNDIEKAREIYSEIVTLPNLSDELRARFNDVLSLLK